MIFARRLAVTLGIPLVLAIVGHTLLLPGVDMGDAVRFQSSIGVFALGVTPFLSAYWVVELTALVVPRWSRLRRGDPEGRAKLERASRILGAIFLVLQAFGAATALRAICNGLFEVSTPVLMASLVGGSLVLLVAARILSTYGLINGLVTLLVSQLLDVAFGQWRTSAAAAGPGDLAAAAVAIVLLAVIGVTAFQGSASFAGSSTSDGPYRGAKQLALHPQIPLPASSFQPIATAASILMIPATLISFGLPLKGLVALLDDGATYAVVSLAVTFVIMVIFTFLLHRPADIVDLASRLGATNPRELEVATRDALKRSLVPSFLLLAGAFLAGTVSIVSAITVVLFVAAVMDATHAMRSPIAGAVVVWEERRPTAVPMLRAALAAEGIASDVRGAATLAFFQIFAPYAPAQIVVAADDLDRAKQTLRHVLLGDEARSNAEPPKPWTATDAAWPARTKAIVLAACAVAAVGAVVARRLPTHAAKGGGAKLEVVDVDDSVDAFGGVPDDALPKGQGMAIYSERVPVGRGKVASSHFVRGTLRPGESPASALTRTHAWFDAISLPPGTRLAFAVLQDEEEDAPMGFRTYLLRGEPVITSNDVVEAHAVAPREEMPAYVALTLSSEGAKRFEQGTGSWVGRRIAILVDGMVNVAPIVKSAIAGGHVSVNVGAGDPEKRFAEAKALAERLRP